MSSLREHLRAEEVVWVAQHAHKQATASPSVLSSSTADDDYQDATSIFSTGDESQNSSITSVASEDAVPPPAFNAPRDFDGSPIVVYASLEQAVASSLARTGAMGGEPRRLVTPGKLYENEEEDDEIEYGESPLAPGPARTPISHARPRFEGRPVVMYTSLEQAVTTSLVKVGASGEGPRRLFTPGKLYENEGADDEIEHEDLDVPGLEG
ncbi:hypothetical protein F5Y15DRAFT_5603 [Xylariaceae sp. FL0016]|nr:hypothetical protein F5Y15DRAFT_5603 [Xylariaceae sp. FL0016]